MKGHAKFWCPEKFTIGRCSRLNIHSGERETPARLYSDKTRLLSSCSIWDSLDTTAFVKGIYGGLEICVESSVYVDQTAGTFGKFTGGRVRVDPF